MKYLVPLLLLPIVLLQADPPKNQGNASPKKERIPNRLIDFAEFERIVVESRPEREGRRLTEDQFIAAIRKPGVVLLDARSASLFEQLHVKGAVNLPFPQFDEAKLKKIIPSKDTPIIIYCNNNFVGRPVVFASKAPAAALNLSSYTALKAYGYTNIRELGPVLDVKKTKIPFSGTTVEPKGKQVQERREIIRVLDPDEALLKIEEPIKGAMRFAHLDCSDWSL